jgi:hypothetical protein
MQHLLVSSMRPTGPFLFKYAARGGMWPEYGFEFETPGVKHVLTVTFRRTFFAKVQIASTLSLTSFFHNNVE